MAFGDRNGESQITLARNDNVKCTNNSVPGCIEVTNPGVQDLVIRIYSYRNINWENFPQASKRDV